MDEYNINNIEKINSINFININNQKISPETDVPLYNKINYLNSLNKINSYSTKKNKKMFNHITKDQNDVLLQDKYIQASLNCINTLMNQAVAGGAVSGSYADAFKGWAKKCSSQAITANDKIESLRNKYSADVKQYTMNLLDSRIAELEEQISSISE